MPELEELLFQRQQDPHSALLLGNLAVVTSMVAAQELPVFDWRYQEAIKDAHQSGMPRGIQGRLYINRSMNRLAEYHDVPPRTLIAFAAGGLVVDVGCGQSEFLDYFKAGSATLAVDLNKDHVAYQAAKGHIATQGVAQDLNVLESASVRLLHAAYSAPFWSISHEDAINAANEYVRVLEPGGVAMVGPFGTRDDRDHYEQVAGNHRYGLSLHMHPWSKDGDAYQTKVRFAFCEQLLARDDITITPHRMPNYEFGFDPTPPDAQVPDFLMIQRHTATAADGFQAPGQA